MIFDAIRTWNRRRIQRYRLSKPVQDTPNGFKFCGLPEMISGEYEEAELAVVRHLLPKVDLLVDAGAHYGFYICVAQNAGVPVVAFEPDRTNVGMIAKNLSANGWGQEVVLLPVATGNERGFFEMRGGGSGGTLAEGYSKAPMSQTQTVPVVRMDDVIELGDRKALIVIDVEGFELNALRGAEKLIANAIAPIFLIEIFPDEIADESGRFRDDYPKIFELFEQANYKAYFFSGKSLQPLDVEAVIAQFNRHDPKTPSGNFLFISPTDEALLKGLV